ncbi:hypothetical protein VVD49_05765 [Uliginosibacterium sp. H3]|uniref:Uncharacterized protein n=1 Tax=Uliginosibacterium silvisoli TaxID=3114758 RepID=A0ABU6K1X9_9RHOO|nr:hypothetical protein [Uliginosibacterium sp. H3]
MKLLPHPSHARTTLKAILALFGLDAVVLCAGLYFGDGSRESTTDLFFAVAFIVLGLMAMALLVLRAYLCRCPQCGVWLSYQPKPVNPEAPRKFVCKFCRVVWDSKVRMTLGG